MCQYDYRIAQRCTLQTREVTETVNSYITLPDLSRALWVVVTSGGTPVGINTKSNGTAATQLPIDLEMTDTAGNRGYVHRRHCGSALSGPLYVVGVFPPVTVSVTWMEIDHTYYSDILNPDG